MEVFLGFLGGYTIVLYLQLSARCTLVYFSAFREYMHCVYHQAQGFPAYVLCNTYDTEERA